MGEDCYKCETECREYESGIYGVFEAANGIENLFQYLKDEIMKLIIGKEKTKEIETEYIGYSIAAIEKVTPLFYVSKAILRYHNKDKDITELNNLYDSIKDNRIYILKDMAILYKALANNDTKGIYSKYIKLDSLAESISSEIYHYILFMLKGF